MANTIQIKRGTGSSVPSSLAEGELAINLDSGKFYYGSGSSVLSDFRFDSITAEKYVISSSVTHMTTSFSSGSTAFGDSAGDQHTFTGNITASGNISSSLDFYARRYYSNGELALNTVNDAVTLGYHNTYPINIGKSSNPTRIYGHLTASVISASGTISANGGTFTDDIELGDTKKLKGARIVISASNNNNIYGTSTFHQNVNFNGDITSLVTLQDNLRIGGASNTSNNWISIDCQDGNDSSGGGITFYEASTYSVNAPRYGAKIVYNEDDDEFAIGTIENNSFKRQIYMKRNLDYVYLADAVFSEGTTPGFILRNTNTTVADGDSLGNFAWTNLDDTGTTLNITGIATEDHADDASGGSKLEIQVTPNGTSALATAVTIDQDKSLTVVGNISSSATVQADTGSFNAMTKAYSFMNFYYYLSANHASELYLPIFGNGVESTVDQQYHYWHAPYNGRINRMSLSWQNGNPGDTTFRVRKTGTTPFDPDDSDDIVEANTLTSLEDDTMYHVDFSASFSKGDVVCFTIQQTGTTNTYVAGTIALEFDPTS